VNRAQLEHIIRAATDLTHQYEVVVVGSQSILGSFPNAPAACVMSMEADVYPLDAEELSDEIDGSIGEFSQFHETYGYYAQGVDSSTSTLPANWKQRLVRVQNENTNGRIGWCLDPTDLFLAKCAAWREKDIDFNRALLQEGLVDVMVALARLPEMPLDLEGLRRIELRIQRLLLPVA
jgi:hypothetical protein